jgi:hypothetical protein
VNEQSEHLSTAQIENYGNRSSGAGPDADQHDEARINAHLAHCPSCRSNLLDFHRANFGLLADPQSLTDLQVNTASTPDCPSEDDLRQLAAGLLPEAVGVKLTLHAATCDHCGQLLRIYTELYSDDFSEEEQAVLGQLKSASPDWAEQTAQKMLRTAAASTTSTTSAPATSPDSQASDVSGTSSSFAARLRRFFSAKWVLIPATAAALAAISVPVYYARRDTPEKVEALLAQACSEPRTMEVRWPGAMWSQYSVQRGTSTEVASTSLLRAELVLDRQTEKVQTNKDWIRAAAEKDIIAGHPQNAIPALEQAIQSYPHSVPLLLDLAIAYFRQGDQTHTQASYEKSRDLLSNVLQFEPSNGVALFNRALVYERLNARDKAMEDWKTFLTIEKDPAWLAEARKKFTDLSDLD